MFRAVPSRGGREWPVRAVSDIVGAEAKHVNEEARKQIVEQLNELREKVSERLASDPLSHDPVAAHVDEVRALVEEAPAGETSARTAASSLERRLLVWEAEHPQLAALASRIARALEDAGL